MSSRRSLTLTVVLLAVLLGGQTLPVAASDPPSHDVTVPTAVGDTVTVSWTGLIPPGASMSACSGPTADNHTLEISVPPGAYDEVRTSGTIAITYDGPLTDVKFSVTHPDGTVQDVDSGFLDTAEAVGLNNPVAGTYQVDTCAFASATPQAYTGTLTLEGVENLPVEFEGPTCATPSDGMTFTQGYIDETRAGGEPLVTTLDDGTLLWGSHAGTTHFFGPAAPDPATAAFIQNYEGQTYQYFSEDDGETWEFAPRTPINADPLSGLPNSGFSDPEFAVDAAGNVFISEINLANVAVSKSTDGGRTYTLQNVLAFTSSDRQWMAADAEDVLYMTANGFGGGAFPSSPVGNIGHFMAKSTDGGVTWSEAITSNPHGVADIQIDPVDGTLYEISANPDGTLAMAAFRTIRDETEGFSEPEINVIATDVGYSGVQRLIDPTFDMDAEGNLYIVWTENGNGARPPGIYYAYSTDRGVQWSMPLRVDPTEQAEIWPWLTVGDPGHVAITYLATDAVLDNNNAELAAEDDGWHVDVLQTDNGLGCPDSEAPGFKISRASSEPVHFSTICQGGTVCQAELVDRRLGDYFSIDIDGNGNAYVAVSDTRRGGAVALPLQLRQTGGPSFFDDELPAVACTAPATGTSPAGAEAGSRVQRVGTADAVGTAVALTGACLEGADSVVLARDDLFPDALAASGLAAEVNAPILLTGSDGLDAAVGDEIARLGAETAYLMGGETALSSQVADDVRAQGLDVVRVGGRERFETAALIAEEIVMLGGEVAEAIVALGARGDMRDAWPDALAAGNLAAAARAPILLSTPDALPEQSAAALDGLLPDGARVYLAGGTEAVSAAVEQELAADGYRVQRLAGTERYGTAVAVGEEAVARGAGRSPVLLATGSAFADALVAAPVAHLLGGVMLLVAPDDLANSQPTADYLSANTSVIDLALLAGDGSRISAMVEDQVRALLTE